MVVGCVVWGCVECGYVGVFGVGCVWSVAMWVLGVSLACVGRVCVVWGCGLVCVCACKVHPGVRNMVKNKCSLRQRSKCTREIQ